MELRHRSSERSGLKSPPLFPQHCASERQRSQSRRIGRTLANHEKPPPPAESWQSFTYYYSSPRETHIPPFYNKTSFKTRKWVVAIEIVAILLLLVQVVILCLSQDGQGRWKNRIKQPKFNFIMSNKEDNKEVITLWVHICDILCCNVVFHRHKVQF